MSLTRKKRPWGGLMQRATPRQGYITAVASVGIAAVLRMLLDPILQSIGRLTLFPLAVMVAAWYGGVGPGVCATLLSLLAGILSYQFGPESGPNGELTAGEITHLFIYLIVGLCISYLAGTRRDALIKAGESVQRFQEQERRATDALALLEPLLANSPLGFAFIDLEFRYVRVNEALARLHGVPPADLIGRTVREMLGEEAWAIREPFYRRAVAGETLSQMDFPGIPRLGWRDLLVSLYPVRNSGRVVGVGIAVSDVSDRRRSERALAESERRLQLALSAARMGAWEWDVASGQVVMSERLREIYGTDLAEFDGTRASARRMIHPDDMERTEWVPRRAFEAGEDFVLEYRIRNSEGEVRWLESHGTVLRDETGTPGRMVGVVADITERKLAELERQEALEAAHRNQERYQAISELTSDFAYSFRFEQDGSAHTEWISDAFAYITGHPAGENVAVNWEEVIAPEDLPTVEAGIERLRVGEPFVAEVDLITRDGRRRTVRYFSRPRWNAERTAVIGFIGAAQDITEQKQVEAEKERALQALQQSEARLRRIFDANLVGLLYAHLDGRFVSANEKFLELVGYSREELADGAMDKERLTAPEYLDVYREAIRQVRANGLAPLYEKEYIRKDGTRVPVLIGNTLLEPDGDVMAAFVLDLTQLKQTQAELSAANARLTAALMRERNIAVALQRSLTQMPAQDAFAGLQVHAVYEPAWEEADVGGDFMDAFLLDQHHMAMVVGDVSGKGLTAAARTAEIKYTLRGMLHERRSPAAALAGLNEYLCDVQRRGVDSGEEFVCVAVAVVECGTGKVVLSVGGSEPPLYVRRGGATEEAQVRGTPLGVFAEMEYREEELVLDHGDLLVLTTDGITEARRGSEFFGYEGLSAAATRQRHTPDLADLAEGLVNEAREFAGGALHDDTCLLIVRRL